MGSLELNNGVAGSGSPASRYDRLERGAREGEIRVSLLHRQMAMADLTVPGPPYNSGRSAHPSVGHFIDRPRTLAGRP